MWSKRWREIEALDLGALRLARAVGDQGELHAGVAQGIDGGVGVGIEPVFVAPHLGEGIGDAIGQRFVGAAEPRQGAPHRQPPGARNVEPPFRRGRRIGPEGARLVHRRHAHALDRGGVMGVEMGGEHMEQPRPRLLGLGVGADQGVVEIEQDGARQTAVGHVVQFTVVAGESGGRGADDHGCVRPAPRSPPARARSGRRAGSGRRRRRPTSRWDW